MDEKPLASTNPLRARVLSNGDPLFAEKTRANLAHASGHRLELLKSAVQAGESALKTLLLINGGAAVAALAFLGNVLSKPGGVEVSVPNFKAGLLRFTLGVALVGGSAACRFIALYAAMGGRPKPETVFSWAALAAGLASLAAFLLGCLWVVGAV